MGRLSATTMPNVLAFDIGGTKVAWAMLSDAGELSQRKEVATPRTREELVTVLTKIIQDHDKAEAVGIGFPGPIAKDKQTILFCTNIPDLTRFNLGKALQEATGKLVALDNDARCALVGEAWQGAAKGLRSAVLLTLGTGVGGAVMQRGVVQPAPSDVSLEISRLIADPDDFFPGTTGKGTVEALIGGKSLEDRYGVSLHEMSLAAHKGDAEALEFWGFVQHSFVQCVRAICEVYGCKLVLVGGKGSNDLDLYTGSETMPCEVLPTKLGSDSGLYGAAQLAFEAIHLDAKDWDEE